MPKVSVLVAVYNAEQYLHECLDSLTAQTLHDIEIICIDDCSTDTSLDILRDYAQRDSRITVLHNEKNTGQAKARNRGLAMAKGEYITMLDSDDWMSSDALEQAYTVLTQDKETDCVLLNLVKVFDEPNGRRTENYQCATSQKMTGYDAFLLSIDWSIHGLYVIRADIHQKYPYDESALLYSDDNTALLHYLHSRKVAFCDGTYFYRQNPDSMTHSVNIRRFDRMEADLSIRNILSDVDDSLVTKFETHRWLNIVGCAYYLYQHSSDFTPQQKAGIHHRIAHALATIEPSRIEPRHKYKFGYYPFRNYTVFRITEYLYFTLRKLISK